MGIISIFIILSIYYYQTTLDSIKFVLLIRDKHELKRERKKKEIYEVKGTKKNKELSNYTPKTKGNPGKRLSIIEYKKRDLLRSLSLTAIYILL